MEETVDLREYFGIVKKRFWIVALITIIAVVVSGVISFFMLNPVYEAKSTLIVNTEKNEETQMITGDQFNVTQKLAVTYGEIIKSRSVLDDVIKNLKLDDEFKFHIK
jgi:capsular polysaccharide biosynthesis protein